MATIGTAIELQDNFTGVLYQTINTINLGLSAMEDLHQTMNTQVDTNSIEASRDSIHQVTIAVQELDVAMQGMRGPVMDTPTAPVNPIISEPLMNTSAISASTKWQPHKEMEVLTNTGMEHSEQDTVNINFAMEYLENAQNGIAQQADKSTILSPQASYNVQSVENKLQGLNGMMSQVESDPINIGTDGANAQLEQLWTQLNKTSQLQESFAQSMKGMDITEINVASLPLSQNVSGKEKLVRDSLPDIPPIKVPVNWQTKTLKAFTNTGIDRFQQELQGAYDMLNMLNNTQDQIAATAAQTELFSENTGIDGSHIQSNLQEIQQCIQAIKSTPLNMGIDTINVELEQLQRQLHQAVQEQQNLNHAVESIDVQGANEAYLRLSQIIGSTGSHVRDNVDEQRRFTHEIKQSTNEANQLTEAIKGETSSYVSTDGIEKAFSFIDDCTKLFNTQLNAENKLMVVLGNMLNEDYVSQFTIETSADTAQMADEIHVVQGSMGEVNVPISIEGRALQAEFDAITDKASEIQSLGIYGDEVIIAGAAELATYFSDVDAIEMMMDTLSNYAMGMSGGGALDSKEMVDYANSLGKIMTGSYEAITKKGIEFTDTQKAIIEGTATQEQIITTLGEKYAAMSVEMQAAATISQVLDQAWGGLYQTMSNTPEGKIIQLNNAWGDMQEIVGGQLYPYVLLFVDTINENWGTIEEIISTITIGLEFMLGILSWVLEGALNFAQVVIDNWGWISPIIYGIIAALAVYGAYLLITKGIELAMAAVHGIMAVAQMLHAAATGTLTKATAADIAAQNGLNAALCACPIVWIIILIIALIALFYAVVGAINKFAGTSISATGLICGAFMTALAFIGNLYVTLLNFVIDIFIVFWNFIVSFANFFANVFNDPVGAIARLFFDLVDTVLSLLQTLASAIDTIFGSNLAGEVQGWRDSLSGWVDKTFGQGEEVIEKLNEEELHIKRFEYGAAWDAGYSFGEGIDESIANFELSDLFGTMNIPFPEDYANSFESKMDSGIDDNVGDITDNTVAIADSMDITEEELKYMRDIAEQEAVNRFTTAEIMIEQTNHNNISSSMDLDGVVSGITDAVNEAVEIMTEGVHN